MSVKSADFVLNFGHRYAALEGGGEGVDVEAAVALGGGGRVLMPVAEREPQRGVAAAASTAAAAAAAAAATASACVGSNLPVPSRSLLDICSDPLIPPHLA